MNFLVFVFISFFGHLHCQTDIGISLNTNKQCGKMINNQISSNNGITTPGDFGWHVTINGPSPYLVSGALIKSRWIITVADVFYSANNEFITDLSQFSIDIGRNDYFKPNANDWSQPSLAIESVFIHPNYLPKLNANLQNNIALVKLKVPVKLFSENYQVFPVCISNQSDVFQSINGLKNINGWLTGWGPQNNIFQNKIILLSDTDSVTLASSVSQNNKVFSLYFESNSYTLNILSQVGASFIGSLIEKNNVDAGSPIVVLSSVDSRFYLFGIVSVYDTKGNIFGPRVSFYSNWIKNIVQNN